MVTIYCDKTLLKKDTKILKINDKVKFNVIKYPYSILNIKLDYYLDMLNILGYKHFKIKGTIKELYTICLKYIEDKNDKGCLKPILNFLKPTNEINISKSEEYFYIIKLEV